MNITIQRSVFSRFPQLKVGLLHCTGINNQQNVLKSKQMVREMAQLMRLTYTKDTIKTHHLLSPWTAAKIHFGNPTHYHTSLEKLLQNILRRKDITTRDTVTNLMYYISLKNLVPISVDDADKIKGRITFRLATGSERKRVLKLRKGDIFYADQKGPLGAKLEYWKSSRTKLTQHSTSLLIHLDALPPISAKKAREILKELKGLIATFCGGTSKISLLTGT